MDVALLENLAKRVAELENITKMVGGVLCGGVTNGDIPPINWDKLEELASKLREELNIPAPDADTPPVNWERCEELASKLTTPAPDDTPQAERGKIDYDKDGDVLYVYFDEPEPYYCAEIGNSERFNVMISIETKQPVGLLVWSVKRWLDSFQVISASQAERKRPTDIGVYSNSDLKHAWSIIVNPSDLRPVRNSEEE